MQEIKIEAAFFQGIVSLEYGSGWIRPWRLPIEEKNLFMSEQQSLIACARESAGARLRFETNAETITLTFKHLSPVPCNPTHSLDLTLDGDLTQTVAVPDGATSASFQGLPPGLRVVEIWLPHDAGIDITGLHLNDGASCRTVSDPRPRWITYGSSLTHCRRAHSPARTWPAIVARRAGLNLLCLGYGGNCCLEPALGLMIRDLPADLITLKLGINCISGALSQRTFGPAVMGLLRIIREKHPRTPLGLISPIAYPPHEQQPNIVGNTITKMRENIVEAAERMRRQGDQHLTDYNGLDLLNLDENATYTEDQCHPNGDGIELMAEHFLERILPGLQ